MSGAADLMIARLEDGEIEDTNDAVILADEITESSTHVLNDLSAHSIEEVQKTDEKPGDGSCSTSGEWDTDKTNQQRKRKSSESHGSDKAYLNNEEIVYIDENEMLCVRGASPTECVVERFSYARKSSLPAASDGLKFELSPPKRRKSSGKRLRKRTPKKIIKDSQTSSYDDEQNEIETPINLEYKQTNERGSLSPQDNRDKLPQLCKFYLQNCCVRGSHCEYMHSEFPCKFYYMGLKCRDESSETGCQLSHGGPLSTQMLNGLARHISTAPFDVLGQEFIEIRSKMSVLDVNRMLQETQQRLKSAEEAGSDEVKPTNDSSPFFTMLREKLSFLNENQLSGLQELSITKADDLLNLTLAQLNAIGIHAIQIEAIQMSLISGQDTDMRSMCPQQLEVPIQKTVSPEFEIVCLDESKKWYEEEERPLVIDETCNVDDYDDDDENEDDTIQEDDLFIDVVGDSVSDSNSSTKEEKENDINLNVEYSEQSQHFIIEETQEGITVLPNSGGVVEPLKTDCVDKNVKAITEEENVDLDSKNQDNIKIDTEPKDLSEDIPVAADLKKEDEIESETPEEPKTSSLETDTIEKQLPKDDKTVESPSLLNDLTENQIKDEEKGAATVDVLALEEIVSDESLTDKNEHQSEKDKHQSDLQTPQTTASPTNPDNEKLKSVVPPCSPPVANFTLSRNAKKLASRPEIIVDKIDLTVSSPPSRSVKKPSPIYFNSPQKRNYNNPFQSKVMCVNERDQRCFSPVKNQRCFSPVKNQRCFSPVKEERTNYLPQTSYKQDNHMQGDNSSEDWDADERSDKQSPSKEIANIASPDQSEDESTPFLAEGINPDFPIRTKNLDNYQPAVEINAHMTYPPIEYKLHEIYMPEYEVNKPTLVDKLLKANSSDPRLKKFIEKEKNCGIFPQAEYSFFPPNIPQCDPRLRQGVGNQSQDPHFNVSRVLYSYLQRSQWYQELKSNLKIQINHSVSDLVRALNFFHKDPSPQKVFDLFQIECAGVLLEVMRNVGIFIDVNGNITEEANYQQLCAPIPQQQELVHSLQSLASGMNNSPKPGLLGFAPPGASSLPLQSSAQMTNASNFARQAFGNDCFCANNNNDFQPSESGFYVGGRFPMNRNQEPGFEPMQYQRQPRKRNFKRK